MSELLALAVEQIGIRCVKTVAVDALGGPHASLPGSLRNQLKPSVREVVIACQRTPDPALVAKVRSREG